MDKESTDRFTLTLWGSFVGSWLLVFLMIINGAASSSNPAYVIISVIRWMFTAGVGVWCLVWVLCKWFPEHLEASAKEVERNKQEYESLINREVERRLQAIRASEWKAKEAERRQKERREAQERYRRELEEKWRKEFEKKLEAEIHAVRTASDATQEAVSDFVDDGGVA